MHALLLVATLLASSPDAGTPSRPALSTKAARAIALQRVPGGTVKSAELEREAGRLVYSFDVVVPGKLGVEEILVDAQSGEVVSERHETPAEEARERQADRKKPDAG